MEDVGDVLDLERYPLDRPASPRGKGVGGGNRLYDEPESLVRRLEYGLRYGNTYPSCLASLA